jgi:hypothetical protein
LVGVVSPAGGNFAHLFDELAGVAATTGADAVGALAHTAAIRPLIHLADSPPHPRYAPQPGGADSGGEHQMVISKTSSAQRLSPKPSHRKRSRRNRGFRFDVHRRGNPSDRYLKAAKTCYMSG